MSANRPLVTVMIATRDRPAELRRTLELIGEQEYQPLEIVIVDDGSKAPVEPVARELWANATVIRHGESQGQCQRRNEGLAASRGEFILQLDDDCCFTCPRDLGAAVECLADRPAAGAVVFDLYNGPMLTGALPPSNAPAGCVRSFVGAAILFRADAVRQLAGYRPFYQSQGEEDEFAFQLLDQGWQIFYCPWILAHHRLSVLNRNSLDTWRRVLGNDIWTLVLHMPVRRLPMEVGWKLLVSALDAVRLVRYRAFFQAIWRCLQGLPWVWRLRQPLSPMALRRYDALRLRSVLPEAEFHQPPAMSLRDLAGWWTRWRNRARDTSFWVRGRGTGSTTGAESSHGTGSSNIARYAHEFPHRGGQA